MTNTPRTCKEDECINPVKSRGWCTRHYNRWYFSNYKQGETRITRARFASVEDRFFDKVNKNGPEGFRYHTNEPLGRCWAWASNTDRNGYGMFKLNGKNVLAHRQSYIMLVGELGELEIDHLCRNRSCVNPSHLEPVTRSENTLRARPNPNACGTCKTEYSAETARFSGGRWWCKVCARRRNKEYRDRLKAR